MAHDDHLPAEFSSEVEIQPLRAGESFAGFRLIELLGAGGMGEVWKAEESYPRRVVALKLIKPQLFAMGSFQQRAAAVERFRREVDTAAKLEHPNIVPLYHAGEQDGRLYYTMQYVEGRSPLRAVQGLQVTCAESDTVSADSSTLPMQPADGVQPAVSSVGNTAVPGARAVWTAAAKYVAQASRGLSFAHRRGYIHRDIKPDNIIIDRSSDTARVTDFGLAKALDTGIDTGIPAQYMAGTRGYMAPEQERDAGNATVQSDIYGLGATLFALLTGAAPRGDSVQASLAEVPVDLAAICRRCLHQDPNQRYESAADLADDLQRFLELRPVEARPIGRFERLRYWLRRSPGPAAASLLAALFGLGLIIGIPIALLLILSARSNEHQQRLTATRAEGARILAESRERSTTANLHMQRAQTARERGDWNAVLECLDDARQSGFPDPLLLEIARAKALRSLGEVANWSAAVAALANHPDAARHAGPILLAQSDVARFQGELERSVSLVQQALLHELSTADQLYAQALVAESTPECMEYLRQAVSRDPYHYEGTMMLVAGLVLSGNRDEARRRAMVANNLFPNDAGFTLWLAVIAAAESNLDEMTSWMQQVEGRMDEDTQQLLFTALETLASFADSINNMDLEHQSELRNLWNLAKLTVVVRRLMSSAGQEDASLMSATRCLPPSFNRAYEPLLQLSPINLGVYLLDPSPLADRLGEAAAVHPEGTLHLMRGGMLSNAQRYADAEQAFAEAAETPAMLPGVNREALLLAAAAAQLVYVESGNPDDLRRAVGYVRRRVQMGPSPPMHSELFLVIANYAQDDGLAQLIIWQVAQQYAGDSKWLLAAADIEMFHHKWRSAVYILDQVLLREPEHQRALELRQKAIEEMGDDNDE